MTKSKSGLPAIILMHPQMGENIGASARAMYTCGLSDLRLIAPRDGWPNQAAWPLAAGAAHVLDNARVYPNLEAACADLSQVWATTARPRDQVKVVYTPRQAANEFATQNFIANEPTTAGLLFGPERAGLDNNAISISQSVISMPLNPEFSSLNLAQAVMVLSWEFHCALLETGALEGQSHQMAHGSAVASKTCATMEEWRYLFNHLFEELDARGFFYPPEKAQSVQRRLQNMFVHLGWSTQEVNAFRGIIKALTRRT